MRTLLFLSASLFLSVQVSAQEMFQRVYGGDSYDVGKQVIQMPDNGYLIAGATGSFEQTSGQIMLIRTDLNGYEEWRKFYGDEYAEQAESMAIGPDGNIVVAGLSERTGLAYQAYLLKLSIDGDTIWTRHYGGTNWDLAHQVLPMADGGYALFGQTYSYGAGGGDFWLLRLDSEGDTLWTKTYGGTGLESGESFSITNEGGFYLTGYTESFGAGKKDVYIVKTDALGDTLWTRAYGGIEDEYAYGSCTSNDGGVITVGGSFSNSPDEGDFMIRKADENGVELYTRIEDGSTDEYWLDVFIDNQGSVVVAGYVEDSGFGKEDVRVMRVIETGTNFSYNGMGVTHGTAENDRLFDIKQTSDNGYVAVGVTGGFLDRFDDVYLLKVNSIGETLGPELGIDEIELDGTSFEVAVGPNPFGTVVPTLYIRNYLELVPKLSAPIEFRLFNNVGQVVYTSTIQRDATRLDGLNVVEGVYFYQMVSGKSVLATGKVVRIR
ncbi:MAG: T9SS type A sorting domain-containing protein [Flavobacteriales bacterium]|nr:T9SS type A sorting domain-containing protein [Flavobacteriales bacterium]